MRYDENIINIVGTALINRQDNMVDNSGGANTLKERDNIPDDIGILYNKHKQNLRLVMFLQLIRTYHITFCR